MSTITVVIANYRYEHLAAQAIESVLCQTRRPDRILLIDDCSWRDVPHFPGTPFPPSLDWLLKLYPQIEAEFRDSNMGVVANFDDILRNHVATDKVMFLGADNWLRPDALELMDAVDADIVSTDIYLFGTKAEAFSKTICRGHIEKRDGYLVWVFEPGNMEEDNHIHGSSLYNVKMAQKFGYKRSPKSYRTAEDWELWKAMLADGAKHTHLHEPLLYYRQHDRNANATK